MSEGAPFCLNPADGERKVMSVGLPVPETAVEIVDLQQDAGGLPQVPAGNAQDRIQRRLEAFAFIGL